MQRRLRLAAGVFAMVAAAACQSKKSSDDALARELDSASGSSAGLLPMSGGTQVVSAIEQSAAAKKNPVVAQPRSTQRTTQQAPQPTATVAEQSPAPQPAPVDAAPVPATTASQSVPLPESGNHYPSPARHPQPRQGSAPRSGRGYPSTGDIIRNAPFPINP